AELAERLYRRTPSSREQADRYRARWADLRMTMSFRPETKEMCFPLVAERSQGARVWDREGNEYVDLAMGFGVNLFGHNPPFVLAALQAQLERGLHVGVQSDLAGEVASRIAAMTGMERVTFCNSGTEAVMTAIRLARAATGRTRIVQFSGSYHGHADPTLAVARPGESAEAGAAPMAAGVPEATSRQVIVLPYGEERALKVIEAELPTLAAVLVEPVQSRRPDLQPAGFLRRLRSLTQSAGVALIFDEVITGFRTHNGGAQAWFGVEADLATYGKVIGGGMPIGVVAGRRRFLDAVDGGLWSYGDASRPEIETSFVAGTFCKHPLAMAAALAVLRHLEASGGSLQKELNERTAAFTALLNADFRAAGVPIEVVSFASLFRFVLARNGSYLYQPLEMDLFFQAMMVHGVYIWEGRTCFLSTAHSEEDLRRIREAARQSVAELCAAGFFTSATPSAAAVTSAAPPTALPPARLPLSPAQRQLWMISRLEESGSLAYTVTVGLELSGRLDRGALDRALAGVVARHEALRTVIEEDGGHQVILSAARVELQEVDLTSAANPDAALGDWGVEQAGRPFELASEPLLRAHLLALSEDRHVLVLAAHHLVVDGWSMGIVVRDLLALYAGSPAPADASFAWRDYLLWQDRQQAAPAMAEHEAYWLQQVEGLRPDLDLSSDHPRPVRKSFRGARLTAELDPQQTEQLRRQSRQQRATPFMMLFAAWSSFLARRAHQRQLTLGVPTSGRPLAAEGTVGYCSHLLPIGVLVEGSETFESYLKTTRETLLAAYQHQDYPFSRLLEKLALAPDPSRTPLFAATFNLERPLRLAALPGLEIGLAHQPIRGTGFDLHLNILDWEDRLTVELDYATDLFTQATAQRLLSSFSGWLAAALARPGERLESLPALSPSERHQALCEWNDSTASLPAAGAAAGAIHDLISEQARKRPKAPAVAFDGAVLTYGELEKQANQTAHFLASRGVSPGLPVGLAVPRGPQLITTLLGLLKAGAFYVPLDPALPRERLAFILENAGVSCVVTERATAEALPQGNWEVVLLNPAALSRQPQTAPEVAVGSQDAAYLLYTSGSTGRPKGVIVEHGPIVNLAAAQRKLFDVHPESRVLQFANLGFDASVSEIFVTLAAGATLCLAKADELLPGMPLVDLLQRERITLVTLPPTVLSSLPDAALPALETVVSAGEACTPEVVARWTAGHRLVNAYGPTEACVCATGTPPLGGAQKSAPSIGRPIDNVRVYLLDSSGDPVAVGAVGEIHIGGAQVARGYWGDPAGTAARFRPDPLAVGGRLYRTGDLARHRADGAIEYLGRCDRQVKLRGIRIELGEIEQTLLCDPGIRDAVVVLREGRLVAYLVAKDPALEIGRVRDRLAQVLSAAMIPSDFVLLSALLLNANGKVDRDLLPAPDAAQTRRRAAYVAPRTPIEETLAAIWQEVLEVDRVGVQDDFLSLGGHSLLSIQIASRIEEAFAVRISLKVIFSGQTLEALAGEVEAALFASSSDGDVEAEIRRLENQSDDEVASLLAEV
ncbi:MAG TPA: amino acid adenylation domain-containing protein, partial [Thermoanaerobaculia bacterium]|nr:amino acid adenylation domain-containing protein [Thermoanaerobaculia bacterium]